MNLTASEAVTKGVGMRSRTELVVFLGLLMAAPALCTDVPAVALPAIGAAFDADAATTQLTLSLFMVGYGLGNVIYGPLSDRWGRRAAMIVGLTVFVIAGVACAWAPSLPMLILFRFCQGLGVGVGPVMARAVVRDRFSGRDAAAAMSSVVFIFALAPIVSPLIGAAALILWGWPAVFAALTGFGAVVLGLTLWRHRDAPAPAGPSPAPSRFFRIAWSMASDPDRRAALVGVCAAYAGMLFYVGGAARVLISLLGLSTWAFSLCFALTGACLAAGALLSGRLARRLDPNVTLRRAILLALAAALALLALSTLFPTAVWAVVAPMCVYSFASGMITPNGATRVLAPFPHAAGTASAALGLAQVCCGALSAYVVGLVYTGGGMALGAGLTACAGVSCLALVVRRDRRSAPQT